MPDPKEFLDSVMVDEDITVPMELLEELEEQQANDKDDPILI